MSGNKKKKNDFHIAVKKHLPQKSFISSVFTGGKFSPLLKWLKPLDSGRVGNGSY